MNGDFGKFLWKGIPIKLVKKYLIIADSNNNCASVVYNNAQSALHARQKLHGFEYPPGERLIVKLNCEMKSFPPGTSGIPSLLDGCATSSMMMGKQQEGRDNFCSAKLPAPQPLSSPNATCAQRCFIVCSPHVSWIWLGTTKDFWWEGWFKFSKSMILGQEFTKLNNDSPLSDAPSEHPETSILSLWQPHRRVLAAEPELWLREIFCGKQCQGGDGHATRCRDLRRQIKGAGGGGAQRTTETTSRSGWHLTIITLILRIERDLHRGKFYRGGISSFGFRGRVTLGNTLLGPLFCRNISTNSFLYKYWRKIVGLLDYYAKYCRCCSVLWPLNLNSVYQQRQNWQLELEISHKVKINVTYCFLRDMMLKIL